MADEVADVAMEAVKEGHHAWADTVLDEAEARAHTGGDALAVAWSLVGAAQSGETPSEQRVTYLARIERLLEVAWSRATSADDFWALADLLAALGRPREARRALERGHGSAQDSGDLTLLAEQAAREECGGDRAWVAQLLAEAQDLAEDVWDALAAAEILVRLDMRGRALEAIERAWQRAEADGERLEAGRLLLELEAPEAFRAHMRALDAEDMEFDDLETLTSLWHKAGEPEEAARCAREALERAEEPGEALSLLDLALAPEVARLQPWLARALVQREAAVAETEDEWLDVARAWLRVGDRRAAREAAERVVKGGDGIVMAEVIRFLGEPDGLNDRAWALDVTRAASTMESSSPFDTRTEYLCELAAEAAGLGDVALGKDLLAGAKDATGSPSDVTAVADTLFEHKALGIEELAWQLVMAAAARAERDADREWLAHWLEVHGFGDDAWAVRLGRPVPVVQP